MLKIDMKRFDLKDFEKIRPDGVNYSHRHCDGAKFLNIKKIRDCFGSLFKD